jgi:hypothetical protein
MPHNAKYLFAKLSNIRESWIYGAASPRRRRLVIIRLGWRWQA